MPVPAYAQSGLTNAKAASVAGAEYPNRPMRFIVPAAVGGGPDVNSRLLVAELSRQMGQNIVVENVPGASGVIGTAALARATADGYTMAQGNFVTLATIRSLMSKLPYDVDKDLQMVMQYGFTSNLLAVSPALPIKTVRDLLDYAKQNPGKMSYGSGGNGGAGHLSGELLKIMTGIQIVHVPYKAAQQAITEIIGGDRKSTRLNSSHVSESRMPSSA